MLQPLVVLRISSILKQYHMKAFGQALTRSALPDRDRDSADSADH